MRGDYRFACYYFITYLIILRNYVREKNNF